jgi:hypothetical protein
MKIRSVLPLFIAFAMLHCSKKESTNPDGSGNGGTIATVEDLLIRDNEISGWLKAGNGWVANGDSELLNFIDGAAPQYTKYGFIEGAEQRYQGVILTNQASIDLRVFDQGNASNAEKVYDEIVAGLGSPEIWEEETFPEAKVQRWPLSQEIYTWKSKYYIKLTIDSNLVEALEVLKIFARNVGSKIG